MTTTSDSLLTDVHAAVVDATNAGPRVYRPGDWPTWDSQYPAIKLRVFGEEKQSLGRGTVEFTVVTTIRALIQVSEPAAVDDGGAAAAEVALWAIVRQFEIAVINSYPLTRKLQQFASIRSQLAFTSEAETHLAGAQIDIALEYYQGPEDFAPIAADPVEDVEAEFPNQAPYGLSITLPQE